jgi:hypothetical protein
MADLMSKFIPGMELCEAFFAEAVRPIVERHFPGLVYSAAKLHRGSDVLGFDTPRSMDHDWGAAKLDLFLCREDHDRLADRIGAILADELPHEFRGLPTDFLTPEVDGGSLGLVREGPVSHRITCTTVDGFLREYIGLNPLEGLDEVDWMAITPQLLRTISHGTVFYDGLEQLGRARKILEWYPDDVWLYMMSSQWGRIDQEEPFMARCGDVGDEIGSRLIAARMVEEIMRLCFLMEREYWPYPKWFGSAFSRLPCAERFAAIFASIFDGQDWRERERHLSAAYLRLAEMHNLLGVTDPIVPEITPFHTRPYLVPHAERFSAALRGKIESGSVLAWPRDLGAASQFAHSTDLLDHVERCRKLKVLFE